MLIASNTMDKDAGPIRAHGTLRSHHRAMMASMSKLTLSAQTFHYSFDNQDNAVSKILTESSELLLMIRNFINTCQDLNLPLVPTDPQWVATTDIAAANVQSGTQQRYSLQVNLAENLETMGTCIQDSAETIIKCIAASTPNTTTEKMSLSGLLFTHFRNLSNQTGLFLGYLDETDFSSVQLELEMKDLLLGKQSLADSLGVLFFQLQALTNQDTSTFEHCLQLTEQAAGSLYEPIELICASVLVLANKNRSRSNSNASFLHTESIIKPPVLATMDEEVIEEEDEDDDLFSELGTMNGTEISEEEEFDRKLMMDRHKSEITSSSSMIPPPPMIRSQTAPPSKNSNNKIKKFFGDDAPLAAVAAAAPTVHERPHFLQYDYGVNEIVFNMEGNVKGGTLPALVERLTMHDYLDMNFINTFLLTYRSFCSSVDLLNLLEARYNLQCPPGLTQEESIMWEEKKLKLVRLRVFNVLKNWLELYYNEDDSILLDRLLEFTQTNIKVTLKFSNGQLESLIERRRQANTMDNGGLKKMILTLPDPPEPILPRNRRRFKLLDIDALEMARQLTIMDFKLYSAIKPIECLDKAWSSQEDDQVADNIRASIEYCNQVTSWVSDVILSQHDIKKRSVLIKYWVQVAEKCRILNNFNTCMAILSAFDNSSVGRLKRTWEVVGARTNQTLQHIRKLMGANRNFTEYRAIIHSINPPCIPFLGIYLQDLTFIEDGNANELKKSKELINFAKRAKTAEVIREIQQYQSSLYQLKSVEDLQEFIRSNLKSTRDEEQLYKESLKLEPREREDEKITRLLQESGFL
ncbi:ras guanine nucleotide exchange factor domain-containing protein [Mucor mucedo]|uniref:ras guanine nucleotide exchange factor domain-containing protein n=1 Tax=Mucor mucedo TaxID=29922 RepID=UPI00221FD8C0|nr:ras guanine nucleotide exchange factor domain-containing protein [Mucor mucedo]KAI7873620.1 ras guanine nucleotide exchange factor domain-containing protein [Mucor mucedo]